MKSRALLIFADSAHTDCKRRGWPSAFSILLESQSFSFDPCENFDSHLFTSRESSRRARSSVKVHFQEGASFGERLENAIETLAQVGYQQIVIIGQDCPDLELVDIRRAFEFLEKHRLVLGPDHRGGCYLIGFHASDAPRLTGVLWQQNTDFRQIRGRFAGDPVLQLPVKLDLDTWQDVWLLARSKNPLRTMARILLRSLLALRPIAPSSVVARDSEQRISWQLPPPLFLASITA